LIDWAIYYHALLRSCVKPIHRSGSNPLFNMKTLTKDNKALQANPAQKFCRRISPVASSKVSQSNKEK